MLNNVIWWLVVPPAFIVTSPIKPSLTALVFILIKGTSFSTEIPYLMHTTLFHGKIYEVCFVCLFYYSQWVRDPPTNSTKKLRLSKINELGQDDNS